MKPEQNLAGIVGLINRWCNYLSAAAVVCMMAFVCADVVLRYFGHPILGSNDIVSLLMVVLVALAMGHTHLLKRNTTITLVTDRFPSRMRAALAILTNCAALILFILVVWQSCALADRMGQSGEGSMTLGIPLHPWVYCMAVGCVLICSAIVVDLVQSIQKVVKR